MNYIKGLDGRFPFVNYKYKYFRCLSSVCDVTPVIRRLWAYHIVSHVHIVIYRECSPPDPCTLSQKSRNPSRNLDIRMISKTCYGSTDLRGTWPGGVATPELSSWCHKINSVALNVSNRICKLIVDEEMMPGRLAKDRLLAKASDLASKWAQRTSRLASCHTLCDVANSKALAQQRKSRRNCEFTRNGSDSCSHIP